MKDNKFCVSRTLTYLVALVFAVVGGFYLMNYVNSQRVTTDSEAALYGGTCAWASVTNYKNGCGYTNGNDRGLSSAMGRAYREDTGRNYYDKNNTLVSRCCVQANLVNTTKTPNASPTGVPPPNAANLKTQQQACADKKGEIAAKNNTGCTYYNGNWTIRQGYVYCSVAMSADTGACFGNVGQQLSTTSAQDLKAYCADFKDDLVATGTQSSNGNRYCYVYTGFPNKGGNAPAELANCARVYKVDYVSYTPAGDRKWDTNFCRMNP